MISHNTLKMKLIIQLLLITSFLATSMSSCSYLKRHDEKKRVYVVKSNVQNVRKYTEKNSKIIGKVYLGDTLKDIKSYFNWVAIEYNNDTGYVSSNYVKAIRIIDNSRVSNMDLGLVINTIRDSLNKYLNWRKWEFWAGIVIMYLISLGLLALCRKFDDILDDDYSEVYSSLPYYTGLFGVLFSFVFMFWREEVFQTIFIKKIFWLPEDNNWISWYMWSLAVLLIIFLFLSFLSYILTYKWKGILRVIYYGITSVITFITGMFIGVFVIIFIVIYLILSLLSGGGITESELLSKATHNGIGSLSLGELRILRDIFRREGYDSEANSITNYLSN